MVYHLRGMETAQPQTTSAPLKRKKNFVTILLILLALITSGSTVFLAYQNRQLQKRLKQASQDQQQENTGTTTTNPDPTADWKTYKSTNYSIEYPELLEIKKENKDTEHVVLTTKNYSLVIPPGNIKEGFKVDISLISGDFCPLDGSPQVEETIDNPSDIKCLLSYSATTIGDYNHGEVKTEKLTVNGSPGIKYEFISNTSGNNNIGMLVKKDGKYYHVLIAYRTEANLDLFSQILSTFEFIQ